MLKVDGIDVYYGNIHALKGVSLEVLEGEIVTLIGANGAGKSTLLKTLSGLLKPKQGVIQYENQSIVGKQAQTIVKAGISHVPEGRRVFSNMTVEENLELGAFVRKDKEVQKDIQKVYELFPRLFERKGQLSGTLSGGEQQMLAMGRAIMARPKLLLLDEPSMGLAPIMVKTIFSIIEEINETNGTTILLVEQNAHMALSIAKRGYVLETGKVVLTGSAKDLQESDEIRMAYLGG
ncbi:ABC transporter ATP-binding protein [Cytobacillus sp. FSL W7-1323]|uniref:ABC transporter ATP-binding protein n=1 Tax=Cytobacillus kochii TaxID=859143 RepID=A0A248TJV7_9BACI|nr:ABC transporter ATP-binding protein [Cytobacillus kochii]ASV68441.1 ABC transporter ATP-binding protein [Cytobacillus kochii]MCA1027871.1 ABC transporter ATP-binding protein [Cytobacillus kochii]MCM3324920.1 ABC transporter ATP-binding protein [Cytobacillus kochii]MCM3347288.1 ABC transporter ATP-binding protein [Cytobacillus kochii]MDM5209087.1 ABC transporter ATP-binding protein [Cytobacillus kochii]